MIRQGISLHWWLTKFQRLQKCRRCNVYNYIQSTHNLCIAGGFFVLVVHRGELLSLIFIQKSNKEVGFNKD